MRARLVLIGWVVGSASGCSGDGGDSADASVDAGGLSADAASFIDAPVARDAAQTDASRPDARAADAPKPPYARLSETGLYADIAENRLAPDIEEFRPAYELWSDGAHKRRWIRLPFGARIDTSDMDAWRFPPGTQIWKEFRVETEGALLLVETRLIQRLGDDPDDLWAGSFLWRDDELEADFVPDGVSNARNTSHQVPAAAQCGSCHEGQAHRVLGFSAVQLSHHDAGLTLGELAEADRLTDPPPPGGSYPVPGEGITRDALGLLHANCGHCHTPAHGPERACYRLTALDLRVATTDGEPSVTGAYRTAIAAELQFFAAGEFEWTIAPGDPEASALHYRMRVRDDPEAGIAGHQMPPDFTREVDQVAVEVVAAWIESLEHLSIERHDTPGVP